MAFTMVPAVYFRIHNAIYICIIITVSISVAYCCEESCQPGIDTPGYTVPCGDIVVEYGDPLDITCTLNNDYVKEHGANSSSYLYFRQDDREVPADMITILDSRSIKLHINKPEKTENSLFTCKLRNDNLAVCLNTVIVGVKPQLVDDFECVGYNYENLTCSWTAPNNYVITNYTLTYNFPGRANRNGIFFCPKMSYDVNTHKMSCFWEKNSTPPYRQAQRTFLFTLNITNVFGSIQVNNTFSHFARVISGPPENLTTESKTTESIYLRWSVPFSMVTFPPGSQHRILYQSEVEPNGWVLGGIVSSMSKRDVYFNLTGLKYAHKLYDIRVSSRSRAALPDDESMWSKNTSLTERTLSKIPGAPPRTTFGSFEVETSTSKSVYLYWQEIPNEIQNGEGFTYEVRNEDHPHKVKLVELKNAYAKFEGLDPSKSYKFLIWSKNDVGRSENYSIINIPAGRVKEPSAFTKITHGDGNYELSWDRPLASEPIVNYTIFWCAHHRDRPYQCTGYLNWTVVPSSKTSLNITVPDKKIHPKIHQFAIAANTFTSSSGMTWAACTVIPNKSVGKMKTIWINNVGSDYIEVGWRMDCSDRIGSVEGFVINYCPILSPIEKKCNGSMKNVMVHGNADLMKGSVRNLKPYTTYMLTVSVVTKHNNINPPSDALFNTTLEGAPDLPRNLKVHDVTNSSVTISWEKPYEMNGVLKEYIIYYNNDSVAVDPSHETYRLTNLKSYEFYNITVVACTVVCSRPSTQVAVRTQVGHPGKTGKPFIQYSNNSIIVVAWAEPEQKRGQINSYTVRLLKKMKNANELTVYSEVLGNNYTIKSCGDDGKYNTFHVSVRAVNVINDRILKGPWSEDFESYCQSSPNTVAHILAPVCVVILLGCVYLLRKVKIRWPLDTKVEIILPEDLVDNTSNKIREDLITRPSPDEQRLLRNSVVDSSGCSSGHESVVSSADSTIRIPSPTDSGTEQPNSSSTEDVGNSSTIRQRKTYVSMPENAGVIPWSSKTSPSPTVGNSYCKLGMDPNTNFESSPAYVPVAVAHSDNVKSPSTKPLGNVTSPYVSAGDMSKTGIHGYVPLAGTSPPQNSTPYVMAGSKSPTVPELIRLNSINSTAPVDKSMYVQVSDCASTALRSPPDSNIWQQPPAYDRTKSNLGYVTIGDAPPPAPSDAKSVYYSHKNTESSCLKED